jgi:hypothetical protein
MDADKLKSGVSQLGSAIGGVATQGVKTAGAFVDGYQKGLDKNGVDFFPDTKKVEPAAEAGSKKTLADFITPGSDTAKGGKDKGKKKESSTSVSGVSSGRPQNVYINIGKLIETMEIEANNIQGLENKIKELVTRTLLTSVNDVNNMAV